jgi:hypothetical protein
MQWRELGSVAALLWTFKTWATPVHSWCKGQWMSDFLNSH